MKTFRVTGLLSADVVLGIYEAETADDALEMANNDSRVNWNPCLCHHCARKIGIGDVYETQAEEV